MDAPQMSRGEFHALTSPSRSSVGQFPDQRDVVTNRSDTRTPAARRQAKVRARRKAGQHHYGMWISDRAVEGLIVKLILEGRLTEAQALRPRQVTQALAALLEE